MSDSKQTEFLFLGGGPERQTMDYFLKDLENNSYVPAVLAQQDPTGNVVVMDVLLPKGIGTFYQETHPNLHFVQGKVDSAHAIPFAADTFHHISLDFVYNPFELSQFNTLAEITAFQNARTQPSSLDDIPIYAQALSEAGRVLKPNGMITLCERASRINELNSVLHTPQGEKWLQDHHLAIQEELTEVLFDETDTANSALLSRQTIGTLRGQHAIRQKGNNRLADDFRVFTIKLTKIH